MSQVGNSPEASREPVGVQLRAAVVRHNWVAANIWQSILQLLLVMTLPGLIAIASLTLTGAASVWAADATTPVDYTQRNAPFTPGANVTPEKKSPETNATVQDKRVDKNVVDKKTSPLGDRRAPIDLTEAREKNVREKESRRPEKIEQPTSAFNHRESRYSTADDTKKPPTVSKYQDSLTSASATNMARFPAMDGATSGKINRFVFRKNGAAPSVALEGTPVTPAAGAAAVK